MRSVQFQIVPCSSLYLFSRSVAPPMLSQCLLWGFNLLPLSLPERFPLLCLFWLPLFASLISTLAQGDEGGHLFRLTCSVVLWGGKDTANKYHWHVWGLLTVYGQHWVCPSSRRWPVLSRSTLLRLQVALQGYCPKQTLHSCIFQV